MGPTQCSFGLSGIFIHQNFQKSRRFSSHWGDSNDSMYHLLKCIHEWLNYLDMFLLTVGPMAALLFLCVKKKKE